MGIWRSVWSDVGRNKKGVLGGDGSFFSGMGNSIGSWRDINTIKFQEERSECRSVTRAMDEFSKFINNYFLIDLLLAGAWFEVGDSISLSILDRFLVCHSGGDSSKCGTSSFA